MDATYKILEHVKVGDSVYVTATGDTFYKGQVLELGVHKSYRHKKSYSILVTRDDSYKFIDYFDVLYRRIEKPPELSTLLAGIPILGKICDIARIVDPLQKKVLSYQNNDADIGNFHCFDFWKKNHVCDNCISMRAYNDNLTYVKNRVTALTNYI